MNRDFLALTLGHDLVLVAREQRGAANQSIGPMLLLAVTNDLEKVLGTMGVCPPAGPSDAMLTIAAEQAMRMFPTRARAMAPDVEKYALPHPFDRDRNAPGFICKCGADANTPVHGRG